MANFRKQSLPRDEESDVEPRYKSQDSANVSIHTGSSPSPSLSISGSSDKENRTSMTRLSQSSAKSALASRLPASVLKGPANKRRRLGERDAPNTSSQATQQRQLEANADTLFYDPDQPMEQRREVRRQLRDLGRQLVGIQLFFCP